MLIRLTVVISSQYIQILSHYFFKKQMDMDPFDGLRHQLEAHCTKSPPLWGRLLTGRSPGILGLPCPSLLPCLAGLSPDPTPLPKSPTCYTKMDYALKSFISLRDTVPSFKIFI